MRTILLFSFFLSFSLKADYKCVATYEISDYQVNVIDKTKFNSIIKLQATYDGEYLDEVIFKVRKINIRNGHLYQNKETGVELIIIKNQPILLKYIFDDTNQEIQLECKSV